MSDTLPFAMNPVALTVDERVDKLELDFAHLQDQLARLSHDSRRGMNAATVAVGKLSVVDRKIDRLTEAFVSLHASIKLLVGRNGHE